MSNPPLILASKSRARQAMIKSVGLTYAAMPANLDESAITLAMQAQKAKPDRIARALAEGKALFTAERDSEAYVIGSDQLLVFEGLLISKAPDRADALDKLRRMQGRTHELVSAVCVTRGDEILWTHVDTALMTMKKLSEEDIKAYAAVSGDSLTECVGGYAIEGTGAWLFDKIEGDYFTVLGMPLLPLLSYLRSEGFGP